MNQSITYEPIKKADYDALENIIIQTWNYDKFGNKKTAKALAKVFLASCLCNQSFTCVAYDQNLPIGIIMGKSEKKHRISFHHQCHQILAIIKMICFKEGRKVLKMFSGFENINKELYQQCRHPFNGEIAFFAVDPSYRGAGIGRVLFSKVQTYMKQEAIDEYYLFTDSSCNYGFYEHLGLKRYQEKKLSLAAFKNKEMSFFLYGTH
ncbi:MAG: GNAT family N-acetyltransferase [Erysipelotrichaceae bacterium]